MPTKKRLDIILVDKGLYESRSKAKRAIMAGKIIVNGEVVDKAGTPFKEDVNIRIKGEVLPYVSRGGLKLAKAFEVFEFTAHNKEAIDIGASTGGFTDCLLQNGAIKVYAIDVGYGQLAWELRQDQRVEVIERTNFRYLTPEQLPVKVPLIVTDVSFISLRKIIPPALNFLEEEGDIIALIKPQFEAGPNRVGKNGVIKDMDIHIQVLKEMVNFFVEKKLLVKSLDFSPITGASSKNIEFLIHLKYIKDNKYIIEGDKFKQLIEKVVEKAHNILERG